MDLYSILKVASMIATGAFGALGGFKKFRDDNEKFTTVGKFAFGGILISLSLSVLLYFLEASSARAAAEKAKAEANATANTLQSILVNAKTTADQQRISLDETNRLKAGLDQTLEQQQSVLNGNKKILSGVTDTLQKQSELFRLNTGTLNQVSRSLYPIKNVAIAYGIRVPMDHEQLKGYRDRFEREVTSLLPSLNGPGINTWMLDRDGSVMRFNFNSQSTLAPHHDSEQLAYELLLNSTIEVELYKTPIKPQDRLELSRAREERINKPDLRFRVFGNLNSQTHLIDYTLESKQFAITSREQLADPFFWSPSGKIVGLTDLLGAQMLVLMPKYTSSKDENFRESFSEIGKQFELQSLFITLADGHELVFMGPAHEGRVYGGRLEKFIGRDGYPVYSFTFPKTLEELRKIQR